MTHPLVVIGGGGFGRETLDVVEAINHEEPGAFELLGVVDDAPSALTAERLTARSVPVLGSVAEYVVRTSNVPVLTGRTGKS